MKISILCPNVDDGCGWSETPNELEDHLKTCPCRPSQCMYCQSVLPANQLDGHSDICLSTKFNDMLKMEETVSEALDVLQQLKDETFWCPNADKNCSWYGLSSEIKEHLLNCEMEEDRPTSTKKRRIE